VVKQPDQFESVVPEKLAFLMEFVLLEVEILEIIYQVSQNILAFVVYLLLVFQVLELLFLLVKGHQMDIFFDNVLLLVRRLILILFVVLKIVQNHLIIINRLLFTKINWLLLGTLRLFSNKSIGKVHRTQTLVKYHYY